MSSILIALAVCMVPALVAAEDAQKEDAQKSELPDKFMLRGGFLYVFGADSTVTLNNPLGLAGIGTAIDFNKTLGGTREYSGFRLDAAYRFNERHSLGFTYYRVLRDGSTTLQEDVTVEDITIAAGSKSTSSLNFDMWRLFYNYSFYHTEKTELGISPGLYMARVKYRIDASATCSGTLPNCTGQPIVAGEVSSEVTLPLPSVGVFVNYHITPKFMAQFRTDFFYMEVGEFQGSMFEFYAGLEYRLFKHVALGASYDRLQVDVTLSKDSQGLDIENAWNTAYVYGAVYF